MSVEALPITEPRDQGFPELLVPAADAHNPCVSIVIPALNEELTITQFVAWCHEGLAAAGVDGEILIVDSSTDRTAELALESGARVLRVPKLGLGRAYIDALPYVRGDFVIMGDADCTYDFRQLKVFVDAWREGYEFVMGSRWKGSIEKGAMPPHHQYFGTPFTTWILNRVYSSKFSDIHCGMRGLTRDALTRISIQSQSWEYASEMVLKSVHHHLRTTEVPVRFLKDVDGRMSHHKRMGWFSPFQAAWINLRAMFVYGADFFVFRPGLVVLALGLMLLLPASFGVVSFGKLTLSLHWQFFGCVLSITGVTCLLLGCVARLLFDYTRTLTPKYLRIFRYTRASAASALVTLTGLACAAPLLVTYLRNNLGLPSGVAWQSHLAVTGLFLIYSGFMLFVNTLIMHAVILRADS
jgi:glycosyltransferase involved in cell wall biosynthesis